MEEKVEIKTGDGYKIYGTLRKAERDVLIIFVHGLTDHQHHHLYIESARFFQRQGISTFRYNQYDGADDARRLENCTLDILSEDLNTVINYFKDYKVFLVGHSFGGPVIVNSKFSDVLGIVFWDPSYGIEKIFERMCPFDKRINAYIINEGFDIILPRKIFRDIQRISDVVDKNVHKIDCPIKIIWAKQGVPKLAEGYEAYFEKARDARQLTLDASHSFYYEGEIEKLMDETLKFISYKYK